MKDAHGGIVKRVLYWAKKIEQITYHTPVYFQQLLVLLETIVDGRDVASPYEHQDAQVIQLVAPTRDRMRVVADRMERRTQP